MKLYTLLILVLAFSLSVFSQESAKAEKFITITKTDGKTVSGRLISQSADDVRIESEGMTISLPTRIVSSISYDNNGAGEKTGEEAKIDRRMAAAREVIRALRPLVIANERGTSLFSFAPMLAQAKADVGGRLREIEAAGNFKKLVEQSLGAYQDALEAWQYRANGEYISASSDYGKWAINIYGAPKKGLMHNVFFEDVRLLALLRAKNYFNLAEAEARKESGEPAAETKSEKFAQSRLGGRWTGEITLVESGKKETFVINFGRDGLSGAVTGFLGNTTKIQTVVEESEGNFLATSVAEKFQKRKFQFLMYLRVAGPDYLKGSMKLRDVESGQVSGDFGQVVLVRRFY